MSHIFSFSWPALFFSVSNSALLLPVIFVWFICDASLPFHIIWCVQESCAKTTFLEMLSVSTTGIVCQTIQDIVTGNQWILIMSIILLLLITFETIWQEICMYLLSLYLSCCFAWTTLTIPERELSMEDQELSHNLGADRTRRRSGLRRRRTMSNSRVEGIVTAELRARRQQPDRPIHHPTDSLLSWTKQVGSSHRGGSFACILQ